MILYTFACIVREILIYHFMKKIKLFIAALVLASAVVAISINAQTSNDPFLEANLEAMLSIEGSTSCISGGPNSTSCELGGNIDIPGLGTGISCAVSCNSKSYACCSITGCHCIEIEG